MKGVALTLVLLAAVMHPIWDWLAKRAAVHDTTVFLWLSSAVAVVFYVPVVI